MEYESRKEIWSEPGWLMVDCPQSSVIPTTSTVTHTSNVEQEPLLSVIESFKTTIEQDPNIRMLFHTMFSQIPDHPPYTTNPSGAPQIRDYESLLTALNAIIRTAPTFNAANPIGAYVSMPIGYILEWPMGTPAGNTLFLHPTINTHLRAILNEWARFLASPASTYVLTSSPETHWFSAPALSYLPNFTSEFICDPTLPHYGFISFDDFFTRRYRPGIRPLAFPDDESVIANPCEAVPFRLAHGVQLSDTFWLKSQPYSLQEMLASDPLTPKFINGTIYQANLGSLNYHRWHSPVSGTVLKAYVVPGSYYSQNAAEGFDPEGPNRSTAYISHVNTRALIFIEADNPKIGTLCFLAIGVQEISSCEISVWEGQKVGKGEEMGMFHFGGSSFCLLFREGVDVAFEFRGEKPGLEAGNLRVRDVIGRVVDGG